MNQLEQFEDTGHMDYEIKRPKKLNSSCVAL